MTATLLSPRPSTAPASRGGAWPEAGPAFGGGARGHLPRPVRRVPLHLVAPSGRARAAAALHRRRRVVAGLVAFLLLAALVLAARTGLAWLGAEATVGTTSPVPAEIVAEPGDTYWSLAGKLHEGGDIRSTVDSLVAANGGRELRAGDRLLVAR